VTGRIKSRIGGGRLRKGIFKGIERPLKRGEGREHDVAFGVGTWRLVKKGRKLVVSIHGQWRGWCGKKRRGR